LPRRRKAPFITGRKRVREEVKTLAGKQLSEKEMVQSGHKRGQAQ